MWPTWRGCRPRAAAVARSGGFVDDDAAVGDAVGTSSLIVAAGSGHGRHPGGSGPRGRAV
jgi:hypothetical protein